MLRRSLLSVIITLVAVCVVAFVQASVRPTYASTDSGFVPATNVCAAWRVGNTWNGTYVRYPNLLRYHYLSQPLGPAIVWLPGQSPFKADFFGFDFLPEEECGFLL